MIKKIFVILIITAASCFAQNISDGNKYALSQAYMQGGQYEKALPLIQQLYNSNPTYYLYFESLNKVYVQLKNYDASIILIQNRIKTDSLNINLYGMLGTTYYLKGNENKAFSVWDNALKSLPQSDMNYRVIADYAANRRAFDKAIVYLREGQNISKNPVLFAYNLSDLYSLTMQYGNATEEYCIILQHSNNQLQMIENKILNYFTKPGAMEKSLPVVEKYAQSDDIVFKLLLARLYVENKNYNKAYNLYQKLDEIQKTNGIHQYNYAQVLYREKQYKIAAKVYDEVISDYPKSHLVASARLGYAKTLEAMLETDTTRNNQDWKPFYLPSETNKSEVNKVINAYIELTKTYPSSEVANESYLRIAKLELNKLNNIDEAIKYFKDITKNNSNSQYAPDAFLGLAKTSLLNNNIEKAASFYASILSNRTYSKNKKYYADYMLARLNFYQGRFDSAKNYLKGILDNLKSNTANDALEMSLLMNTSRGDSSNLVNYASAEYLAEQRKFAEAAEKFKSVAADPQKLMLQNLAMLRQAQMELALNNYDTTISLLKNIVGENEKNIYADKALYLLGEIYQYGLKDKKKAVETYESLLAKFPNSLYLDDARAEIIKIRGSKYNIEM